MSSVEAPKAGALALKGIVHLYEASSRILSNNNLEQALDISVRQALDATQAQSVAIYLIDSDGRVLTSVGRDQDNELNNDEPMPRPSGYTQKIWQSGQPIIVTGDEPGTLKNMHPHIFMKGFQAFIGLPLVATNRAVLGVFYVRYTSPHHFTEFEKRGLTLFASQVTRAIQYLRLQEEVQQRELDLGIMVDNAHMLNSTLNMDELLQHIAIRLAWVTSMYSCSISSFETNPDRIIQLAHYTALGEKVETGTHNLCCHLDQYTTRRWVFQNNEPFFVAADQPESDPAEIDLLNQLGYNSLLMVPLTSAGKPVGLVELYGQSTENRFGPREFKRLRALSEQVALALVNARHYSEEQRARLTAETLRQATAAINSTLDLNEVLNLILEQLQLVVNYDSASLWLLEEEEKIRIQAVHGHPHPEQIRDVSISIHEDVLTSEIVCNQTSLIIPDIKQDHRFINYTRSVSVRCWMGIPILMRGEVIGVMALESHTPEAYTQAEAGLALVFASQAALAFHNARLYQSERDHRNLAEAMSEIGMALSSSIKASQTFDILLEQIQRVVPYDTACVMMAEAEYVRIAGQRGFDRFGITDLQDLTLPIEDTPNLKEVAASLHTQFIPDVKAYPGWVKTASGEHVGSWLGAPLVARDRLLGFLSLDKVETNFYTSEHASKLETLAGHASLALVNALAFGEMEQASITDFITGAYNHRYFQQQLRSEVERATRMSIPLSLLIIDLDRFKNVNDTYGHLTGDQVLKIIAERLKNELRASDLLARYGGEEFAVLLPNTPSNWAEVVAERLRRAVTNTMRVESNNIIVTISIGVATLPDHAADSKSLVASADLALYQAKDKGRNRVEVALVPEAPAS